MPAPLYSYSYELNPSWTRLYAPQPEIWDYLRMRAEVRRGRTSGTAARSSGWTGTRGQALAHRDRSGGYLARAVVSAGGALHIPSYPDIPGAARFGGTAFHSSRWDHSPT